MREHIWLFLLLVLTSALAVLGAWRQSIRRESEEIASLKRDVQHAQRSFAPEWRHEQAVESHCKAEARREVECLVAGQPYEWRPYETTDEVCRRNAKVCEPTLRAILDKTARDRIRSAEIGRLIEVKDVRDITPLRIWEKR
jgi:hypothetical protein